MVRCFLTCSEVSLLSVFICKTYLCKSLPGTPVSDTVCELCPDGHFSPGGSSTKSCQPHTNCSELGLKTLRWGTSTADSQCGTPDKKATLECSHHHTLCQTGENIRAVMLDMALQKKIIWNVLGLILESGLIISTVFIQHTHINACAHTHKHTCTSVVELTSAVNNLKINLKWIISNMWSFSLLKAGDFLGQVHCPDSNLLQILACLKTNTAVKTKGLNAGCLWHCCQKDPWWINYPL